MRSMSVVGMVAALGLAGVMGSSLARADDVVGQEQMLCAIVEVNICVPGAACEEGPPWVWNVPDFIEVDLSKKELRTTRASGENRRTPIRTMHREDGNLVLSGLEMGRAFVFSIQEDSGELTITMATLGKGGVGFGTCTPD